MKPLTGVTILDISRLLPGGFASLLLADYGARVIKVEQPGVGDYYRAVPSGAKLLGRQVEIINQGKEALALDLKAPEGREIFLRLVKKADVVLENFRPGTLKKLKLDYPVLRRANRSILLCSITGLGQKGPRAGLAGHDLNYLGLSGLLHRIKDREGRYVIPDFQVVDLAAGYEASLRIVAHLLQTRKSRRGAWIDVSMVGAGHSLARLYTLEEGPSLADGRLARYDVYETADGRWVTLAALESKFWIRFCAEIGHPEWVKGTERFEVLAEEKKTMLREIFRSKTADEWIRLGAEKDLCLFLVEKIEDLDLEPQKAIPGLGQQTAKILRSIGIRPDQIRSLRSKRVIE